MVYLMVSGNLRVNKSFWNWLCRDETFTFLRTTVHLSSLIEPGWESDFMVNAKFDMTPIQLVIVYIEVCRSFRYIHTLNFKNWDSYLYRPH
jgi:hypothetical protein